MNVETIQGAKRNLERVVAQVVDSAEQTIVIDHDGRRAVLISLAEYNSWRETCYLLSSLANAKHLHNSIAEAEAKAANFI